MTNLPRRAVLTAMAGAGLAASAKGFGQDAGVGEEAALEPDLPIIDCHHHLHAYRDPAESRPTYLPADFARDIAASGHRITHSVFIECSTMYRTDGPEEERSLGETDYVRGVAEASAAGRVGPCRIASAMVGRVDLRRGTKVRALLEQHVETSGGRLRGVRNSIAWDSYPPLAAMGLKRDLLSDPAFREGFAELEPLNLGFDIWLFHPQMRELIALSRAFPGTRIILDHLGSPLGIGPYAGQREAVFAVWKGAMAELARSPNVMVKLGGLGPFGPGGGGFAPAKRGSAALAADWKPYVETAIGLFGTDRCMFESNWSANAPVGSYGAHWNAYKRITAGYSDAEKAALYGGTARRAYRLA